MLDVKNETMQVRYANMNATFFFFFPRVMQGHCSKIEWLDQLFIKFLFLVAALELIYYFNYWTLLGFFCLAKQLYISRKKCVCVCIYI